MSEKLNVSQIDKAINAAKARKLARGESVDNTVDSTEKMSKKSPRAAKRELSAEELAAKANKEAERSAKRLERASKKPARVGPAHMKKVEKAAERLSPLDAASVLLFNEATASMTQAQLASLALHIQHFNRVKATQRAADQKVEVGQQVTILSGDSRVIGRTGTVTKAQRIRCYVQVDGIKKDVYLFTSDVQPVGAEIEASSATA